MADIHETYSTLLDSPMPPSVSLMDSLASEQAREALDLKPIVNENEVILPNIIGELCRNEADKPFAAFLCLTGSTHISTTEARDAASKAVQNRACMLLRYPDKELSFIKLNYTAQKERVGIPDGFIEGLIDDEHIKTAASVMLMLERLTEQDLYMLRIDRITYSAVRDRLLTVKRQRQDRQLQNDEASASVLYKNPKEITGTLTYSEVSTPLVNQEDDTSTSPRVSFIDVRSLLPEDEINGYHEEKTALQITEKEKDVITITPKQWENLIMVWANIGEKASRLQEAVSIHTWEMSYIIEEQAKMQIQQALNRIMLESSLAVVESGHTDQQTKSTSSVNSQKKEYRNVATRFLQLMQKILWKI